jgi:hypothetical protein
MMIGGSCGEERRKQSQKVFRWNAADRPARKFFSPRTTECSLVRGLPQFAAVLLGVIWFFASLAGPVRQVLRCVLAISLCEPPSTSCFFACGELLCVQGRNKLKCADWEFNWVGWSGCASKAQIFEGIVCGVQTWYFWFRVLWGNFGWIKNRCRVKKLKDFGRKLSTSNLKQSINQDQLQMIQNIWIN